MIPRGVKLFWAVGALLVAAVVAAVLLCPWVFPSARVSDLYNRYKDNPHLAVTYLQNFPLNDTLVVDVTTFQALDDEGWDTLCVDFEVPELPELILSVMEEKEDFILSYKVSDDYKDFYEEIGICHDDVIAISYIKQTVSIFNTQNETEKKAVLKYNIKQSIN